MKLERVEMKGRAGEEGGWDGKKTGGDTECAGGSVPGRRQAQQPGHLALCSHPGEQTSVDRGCWICSLGRGSTAGKVERMRGGGGEG